MGVGYNPRIVTDGLLLSLDFNNTKCYTSGTTASSIVNPHTFTFKNGATYNSVANGILTTTRADSTANKATAGGGIYSPALTGSLAVSSFLYNDFTWEVWFKINDRTPSNYDANETQSTIARYRGYHAGFGYNTSNVLFNTWDGLSTTKTCASWTLGTTTQSILQGFWYQLAVVRSGNVYTPYVNGLQEGTGSTNQPSATGIGTANDINIGSMNSADYMNYAKLDFSNMRMYNRALTAAEIQQNFNALRGRFGI